MIGGRGLAAVALAAAGTGCVMPDQLAQYQKDTAAVQASLQTVTKEQADLSKRIAALEAKTGGDETVKRSDVADLKAQMDNVVRQTTATADRVEQVNGRVDRLSQDVQAAKDAARRGAPLTSGGSDPGVVPSGVAPAAGAAAAGAAAGAAGAGAPGAAAPSAGSAPNPNALYTSAYADFSKGNYALAIQGFEEYAQRYPDTDLADNALYWIGECNFSQGSYKSAIDAFDTMLEKYPKSDKAAAANLKKALAFVQLNQIGQGIEQLRYVTATYPGTDEARIASDRLAALGKP
jgi:tol-pal system protein YbgF